MACTCTLDGVVHCLQTGQKHPDAPMLHQQGVSCDKTLSKQDLRLSWAINVTAAVVVAVAAAMVNQPCLDPQSQRHHQHLPLHTHTTKASCNMPK
jgi:hypothetical protein